MSIAAGNLDRRITLRQPVNTRNDLGETIVTMEPVQTVWARVTSAAGSEEFRAEQRSARQEVTFEIRWYPGLDPTWDLVHDDLPYEILDISEMGRRQGLMIRTRVRERTAGVP